MKKTRKNIIKKQVIFIFCIFCVKLFFVNEIKCNASCINEENPSILGLKQGKLTRVDNDEAVDMEDEVISLWNEKYMNHFFEEIQDENSFSAENGNGHAMFHAKTIWNSILKGEFSECWEECITTFGDAFRKNLNVYLKIGYWVLFFSILFPPLLPQF